MKKADFGWIYHVWLVYQGNPGLQGFKGEKGDKGKQVSYTLLPLLHCFNYLYPINNQLAIYYRGTLVLVVQLGRKASRESL